MLCVCLLCMSCVYLMCVCVFVCVILLIYLIIYSVISEKTSYTRRGMNAVIYRRKPQDEADKQKYEMIHGNVKQRKSYYTYSDLTVQKRVPYCSAQR